MFNRKPHEDTDLEKLITKHIESMDGLGSETEDYTAQAANLKVLMEVRQLEDQIEKPSRPSADTLALIAGNLAGIALILSFEKANVITSKGLSFIMKPKI